MSTCGVGGWGGPLPGDPGNNSILSATPAFGGIDVAWTYPTTNPFAVAYTKIYRALISDFNAAILVKEEAGTSWYDKKDSATRYYYWITIISVNGTVGALIGPASAVAKPLIEDMIEQLTGRIDTGVLAMSLKTKIDRIQTLGLDLASEVVSRENGEVTLGQAMAAVNAGVAQTLTFLSSEQTSRVNGDSALATSVELVAVTAAGNLAATTVVLRSEIAAGGGADVSALSARIETVSVQSANNLAAAQSSLHAEVVTVDNRVTSLSSHVNVVETQTGTNLAQAETRLTTNINTVGGKVTQIGALYTAKVSVNGLVGGFGVYNDGTEVDAGFDVDRFWIGRTAANKRKPFIIDNGVVYIDEAAINKLTFSKLRDEAGSFIVENGKVKADFISIKGLSLTDAAGNVVIAAGTGLDFNTRFALGTSGVPTNYANSSGAGGFVNSDPMLRNPAEWERSNTSAILAPTFGAGEGLQTAWYSGAGGSCNIFSQPFPVSSTKTYSIESWIYRFDGNTATHYLTVIFLDALGAVISGSSFGIGWPAVGTYHYWGLFGSRPAVDTSNHYAFTFGALANAKVPPNAVAAKVGILGGYGGAGRWAWGDVRVMEATAQIAADAARAAAFLAQGDATSALASTEAISSDAVLSRGEKPEVILKWTAITQEQADIDSQANYYGVARAAYDVAIASLSAYLSGLAGGWSNTATDSPIVASTWQTLWSAVYSTRQTVLNGISAAAGKVASWAGVSGAGKPADNATVGATWDANITGQPTTLAALDSGAALALASKLSKSGADTMIGPISLAAATAILVGSTTDGLYIGNTGFVGRKSGLTTFSIDAAGNATFAGLLEAAGGTFDGTLTTLALQVAGARLFSPSYASSGTLFFCTDVFTDTGLTAALINPGTSGSVSIIVTCDFICGSVNSGGETDTSAYTVPVFQLLRNGILVATWSPPLGAVPTSRANNSYTLVDTPGGAAVYKVQARDTFGGGAVKSRLLTRTMTVMGVTR